MLDYLIVFKFIKINILNAFATGKGINIILINLKFWDIFQSYSLTWVSDKYRF